MKNLTENQKIIEKDILRYKSNKLASMLAILGLVFNCLYFMLFYSINNEYFYSIEIGFSVILTLIVLLLVFYSSVGVKGYIKQFSYVLWVIAAVQVIRLVVGPIFASTGTTWFLKGEYEKVMEARYFGIDLGNTACCIICVVYLAASAACLIASGVVGFIRSTQLANYHKQIESGEIVIEDVLKQMDKEEEDKVSASVNPVEIQEVK